MSEKTYLTSMLWFLSSLVLIGVFVSAGMQGELTLLHIIVAFTILVLSSIATPFLLRMKDSGTQQEKSKRERIDLLLRDMSDEDLVHLKQRLADGDFSEETLLDYLTDDGEMVMRN